MNQQTQRRKLEALRVHVRVPHCFGTLKQHIIICNECSKQFECLQEYKTHELLLQHA
jgi:hypothetical protein